VGRDGSGERGKKGGRTGLAHNKDVVTTAEGIGEEGSGAKEDVRVGTLSLTGRGTVEVPLLEVIDGLDGTGKGLHGAKREGEGGTSEVRR
jgi:hypothetical protein